MMASATGASGENGLQHATVEACVVAVASRDCRHVEPCTSIGEKVSGSAGGRYASTSRAARVQREAANVHAGAENVAPIGAPTRRSPRVPGSTGVGRSVRGGGAGARGGLHDVTNIQRAPREKKHSTQVERSASACKSYVPYVKHPPTPWVSLGMGASASRHGFHAPSRFGASVSTAAANGHTGGPPSQRATAQPATHSAAPVALLARSAPQPQQTQLQPPPSASRAPMVEPENDSIQGVGEYAQEIFGHMLHEERAHMPRPNYMELQKEANGTMRAILVDWLVEVHMKYRLRPETLYLTVNLIDRYMTLAPVIRKRLQLVGVVAMFIAAKFEEITPPEVTEFAYITDNAYTKDDILQMECTMLTTLSFDISVPTAAHFFDRWQGANLCDKRHKEVTHFLAELALLEISMIRYAPSHLVAAATLLSNELIGRTQVWPSAMVQQTRYSESDLRTCANELRALLEAAPNSSLQAVRRRYMLDKHCCVASLAFTSSREA
mmetsp:Transcript_15432/g.42427  ORF Transcript_15432/g.42427 Transcript_15432/m.42427 type:complete len:496 (-) Transcript_15432:23-1510(-)